MQRDENKKALMIFLLSKFYFKLVVLLINFKFLNSTKIYFKRLIFEVIETEVDYLFWLFILVECIIRMQFDLILFRN